MRLMPVWNQGMVGESGRPLKQVVLRNAARCEECKDTVESTHRHDFVSCSCGGIFVDGGLDYLRRGFSTEYTDLGITAYVEMTNDEIAEVHSWGFLPGLF